MDNIFAEARDEIGVAWAMSSSWVPYSAFLPFSRTRSLSALRKVESLCAMAKVVRPLTSSRQHLLNLLFHLGVHRAGGFVEDQNLGIVQDRSRNGDPLALARRSTFSRFHQRLAVREYRLSHANRGG